ncbi:MAG: trypsin-like serine protease [Actinomycetaceae bacterium]|nr:trypsin-like serine protease [Actinomycetaceae bacterium]MDU0970740.1 trypsin-like serine protease [Actinomycetaceae bacterium]
MRIRGRRGVMAAAAILASAGLLAAPAADALSGHVHSTSVVARQTNDDATITWFGHVKPSVVHHNYWTSWRIRWPGVAPGVHQQVVDPSLTSLVASFSDAPEGQAVETEGNVIPQMGLVVYGDHAANPDSTSCSGVVVHSPTGDRVVTAAHCLSGITGRIGFIPDYHDGKAPYGVWEVEATAVDADYPDVSADQAVLKIAPRDGKTIEEVVGGLPVAYDAQLDNDNIIMAGYPSSTKEPRLCRAATTLYQEDGASFLYMNCKGMPGGVSGGPWVRMMADGDPELVGVTGGGRDGGGENDDESVAVPMSTARTRTLITMSLDPVDKTVHTEKESAVARH